MRLCARSISSAGVAWVFYQGHAQGPPELHRFDVFANDQTLMRGQSFQPVSDGFTARRSLVKVNLWYGYDGLRHLTNRTIFGSILASIAQARIPSFRQIRGRRSRLRPSCRRACGETRGVGGIAPFLQIMSLAAFKGHKLAPHFAMEIHLHLAAACPQEPWLEHFEWLEPMFNERLELKEGRWHGWRRRWHSASGRRFNRIHSKIGHWRNGHVRKQL